MNFTKMDIMKPIIFDKALVILSGGQDSTICLYWSKLMYNHVEAITFDYGQRHNIEIDSAKKIAEMAEVKHHLVEFPNNILIGTSPLVDRDKDLEKYSDYKSMVSSVGRRVENTFVPMRNALFLTIAANRAVSLGINHIVVGCCEEDTANYPDCTSSFIAQMAESIRLSLDNKLFQIVAPVLHLNKARAIKLAMDLDGCFDALAYSHTAYDGKYPPTGNDHASILRAESFKQADIPDPLVIRAFNEGLMELPRTKNYDRVRKNN